MARAARLAHLHAVTGTGIRIGDPNGPHVMLTPEAVRVHRVKDVEAGLVRDEVLPWEWVRELVLRAPRASREGLGRRALGWVGALLTSDVPSGRSAQLWVDGWLTVVPPGDDARAATWRFQVLAMIALTPAAADADAAEALLRRLTSEPALRDRLGTPEELLDEARRG